MNKDLFTVLEATSKAVHNTLDADSQRYLDRCIMERRLDGQKEYYKKKYRVKGNLF